MCENISVGISKNQLQVEQIINTLSEVETNILDEKWEEIYRNSEKSYLQNKGVKDDSNLSIMDRINIATIAATLRENILNKINDKKMIYLIKQDQIQKNS